MTRTSPVVPRDRRASAVPFAPFATLAFTLFGALLVLVGMTQYELARSIDLDLARSGLLASSLVLGIGIGVLAAGPLADRFDRRLLFVASAGTTGVALLAVDASMGFERALAHLLLSGMGGGLYETLLNTETIERYRERSVRVMTLLHAATTVGAMAAPFCMSALVGAAASDWTGVFRFVGAAHLALVALALLTPFNKPVRHVATLATEAARPRVMTPALAALCVAAFAYVGVESAITAFSVPYAVEGLDLAPERGRAAISALWLGLLAGRLVFAWRATPDDVRPVIGAGAIGGAALLAGVLFGLTAIELLVAIVGFALGSVFPLLVALAGRRTPHATGSAVGLVAGIGSIGGFVIPWLTGILGDRIGIAFGLGALAPWCVLIALAALYAHRAHAGIAREQLPGDR